MVFVEEKYNPQTSHGTPSSQLGAVTGLRELALVLVRACSCSQIPSQYPIIAGVGNVGLGGSQLLQLATGRSMEIINWVLDAITFREGWSC